jgi:aspartyl-tRNA(Asn)/glutamyl-tRNA(Gln) amidotransferase subunit B
MDLVEFLETSLPELPDDARERLQADYGLSSYLANVITSDPPAIHMFDDAVAEATSQTGGDSAPKGISEAVANLLCNELFALVREHETIKALEDEDGGEVSVKYSAVSGKQLGIVVAILTEGTISNTMAKQLLRILYTEEQEKDPRDVASERGFRLITDAEELASICRAVIEENPEEMERYRMGGKFAHKITKFLLGKAMQKSMMNAHPERLNEMMIEVLDDVAPDAEK